MSTQPYNSRCADKFVLRLPEGYRDRCKQIAKDSGCSMNSVFAKAIGEYINDDTRIEEWTPTIGSLVKFNSDGVARIGVIYDLIVKQVDHGIFEITAAVMIDRNFYHVNVNLLNPYRLEVCSE